MKRHGDSALLSLLSKQHKPGKLKRPREDHDREASEPEHKLHDKRIAASQRSSSAGAAAAAALQSAAGSAAKRSRAETAEVTLKPAISSPALVSPAIQSIGLQSGYDDDLGDVVDVGEVTAAAAPASAAFPQHPASSPPPTADAADEDAGEIEEAPQGARAQLSSAAASSSSDVHELQGAATPFQRPERMPLFAQMFAGSSAMAVSSDRRTLGLKASATAAVVCASLPCFLDPPPTSFICIVHSSLFRHYCAAASKAVAPAHSRHRSCLRNCGRRCCSCRRQCRSGRATLSISCA